MYHFSTKVLKLEEKENGISSSFGVITNRTNIRTCFQYVLISILDWFFWP